MTTKSMTMVVLAALAIWLSTSSPHKPDALMDGIRRELGPQPPYGTAAFDEYVVLEGCMYVLERTQAECRKIAREAQQERTDDPSHNP
jgi:hypothetical protein